MLLLSRHDEITEEVLEENGMENRPPQSDRCAEMSVRESADGLDFPARLTSDHFFRHHEGRPHQSCGRKGHRIGL